MEGFKGLQVNFNIELKISEEMYDWIYNMSGNTLILPIMNMRVIAISDTYRKPIHISNTNINLYRNALDKVITLNDIDGIGMTYDIRQITIIFQEANVLYLMSRYESDMMYISVRNTALENVNSRYDEENTKLKARITELEALCDGYEKSMKIIKSVKSDLSGIPD